ncbi:hypothetical protein HGRIS_005109 [Hohenbuehelia grisea]|uniref:Afadin and alpha-actinin-binding-domain-containing protein n=1 Tax=Hohenbuehelia grisea TaxID=104357 RepID=A0ABR3JEZ8_9AGAR
MVDTPKVHWGQNVSFSDFGSPFSQASSATDFSSSSVQYLNAQLVAHGFAPSPGICLDGLSATDAERVVKCFLGMLGQRMDDMARTEELSTKFRTLSYDHERLMGMHKAANDSAANAAREMNVHKSRLDAAARNLQSSELAHKKTTAELQRTRTTLQALRLTHTAELKKRDMQTERMQDRWNKLADIQGQLGKTASGFSFRCGNAAILTGNENCGRGQGFLDIALEQAEEARSRLDVENLKLKRLAVRALNELRALLYEVEQELSEGKAEEPPIHVVSSVFPLHPPNIAADTLHAILSSLQTSVSKLSRRPPVASCSSANTSNLSTQSQLEVERLNKVIDTLRTQLDEAKRATQAAQAEVQAVFDKFAADKARSESESRCSVDPMTAIAQNAEQQRLEELKTQLDVERNKFTEAAVRLGKERVTMEAERVAFLEEKREWQVQQMLADLPPTPLASSSSLPNRTTEPLAVPKVKKPKTGSPRKPKVALRPRIASATSPRKSPRKPRLDRGVGRVVELAAETELVPVLALDSNYLPDEDCDDGSIPNGPADPNHLYLPAADGKRPQPPSIPPSGNTARSGLLPTSFVLPPPSPNSSLPKKPVMLSSAPSLCITPEPDPAPRPSSPTPPAAPLPQPQPLPTQTKPATLKTPSSSRASSGFPYPVAKPLALGMVHAYSPARPSPLSRILMLADSPELSANADCVSARLTAVSEEDEAASSESSDGVVQVDSSGEMFPRIAASPSEDELSLAAQLGVESEGESDSTSSTGRESPLQEKKIQVNASVRQRAERQLVDGKARLGKASSRVADTKRPLGHEKLVARLGKPADAAAKRSASSSAAARKVLEKENKLNELAIVGGKEKERKHVSPADRARPSCSTRTAVAGTGSGKAGAGSTFADSKARLMAKIPLPPPGGAGRGAGPRRVLIDSDEAPVLSRVRKG